MITFNNPNEQPISGDFNLKAFNIVYDSENYDTYYNCGNKLKAKETVADLIGEEYVLPVLSTGDTYQEAIDAAGRNKMMLKYNLFSCINSVVIDNKVKTRNRMEFHFEDKEDLDSDQLHYWWRGQEGKWFTEPLLEGRVHNYRFYCYKGEIMCLYHVDYSRNGRCMKSYPELETYDWSTNGETGGKFVKPKDWDKMVELVETLCADFPIIRIDMMVNNDNIYFGEFTPTFGGFYAHEDAQEPLVKMMEEIDAEANSDSK